MPHRSLLAQMLSKNLGQIMAQIIQFLGFHQVGYEIIAIIKLSRSVTSDIEGVLKTVRSLQDVVPARQSHHNTSVFKCDEIAVVVEKVNKELKDLTQKVFL